MTEDNHDWGEEHDWVGIGVLGQGGDNLRVVEQCTECKDYKVRVVEYEKGENIVV